VAHVLARGGRAQPVSIEPHDDDGDVVRAAPLVGERDEPVARRLEIPFASDRLGDLVPLDLAREAVRAQHQDIALADVLVGEVHLDLGIGAERLEDDVAPLAARGLLLGELARFHQPLHQRLVLRELDRLTVADQVGAAVADLREVDVVVQDADGRRGGPHPADLGVGAGIRVDLAVRHLDGLLQPVREPLRRGFLLVTPRPDHLVVDGVGRHLAGELTRGGAPHAVRHDEQRPALPDLVLAHRWLERRLAAREIRHEKAVLVMVARLAEIGLGADLDLDGFG